MPDITPEDSAVFSDVRIRMSVPELYRVFLTFYPGWND